METERILAFLRDEIHTAVMATADDSGNPVTCAIDVMDGDGSGLYFLTAKGKNFYARLKARGFAALTGIAGDSTMTRVAVSVRGKVKEQRRDVLRRLLEKNPYMYEIYPTEVSREGLVAFRLYEGEGEWFDLSKKPVERQRFSFGGAETAADGYFIGWDCIGCGKCLDVCPQSCIRLLKPPAVIVQEHCLRCGNCAAACPAGAVRKGGVKAPAP